MSTNDKDYQKKYMQRKRLSKALPKIIKSLQDCVKDLAKTLQECVKDSDAEPLHKCVKESIEPLQVCVKELSELPKPLQVCVKELPLENGEIREKTAVLPENGEIFNASPVLAGGKGGIFSKNNTIKSNNSIIGISTLTDVTVKRELGTKKKIEKKEKFAPKIYSANFEIFYKNYPNKNLKDRAFKYWERFRKAGSLPSLVYLLACVEIFKKSSAWQNDLGRYIPMCGTWVYNRRWEDLPEERVNAYIEQMKAWKARAEEEADKAKEKEKREAEESLGAFKNVALPTLREWTEMDVIKKCQFFISLNPPKGLLLSALTEEIARRENQPAADARRAV